MDSELLREVGRPVGATVGLWVPGAGPQGQARGRPGWEQGVAWGGQPSGEAALLREQKSSGPAVEWGFGAPLPPWAEARMETS